MITVCRTIENTRLPATMHRNDPVLVIAHLAGVGERRAMGGGRNRRRTASRTRNPFS